jgi:hypothetical protein
VRHVVCVVTLREPLPGIVGVKFERDSLFRADDEYARSLLDDAGSSVIVNTRLRGLNDPIAESQVLYGR